MFGMFSHKKKANQTSQKWDFDPTPATWVKSINPSLKTRLSSKPKWGYANIATIKSPKITVRQRKGLRTTRTGFNTRNFTERQKNIDDFFLKGSTGRPKIIPIDSPDLKARLWNRLISKPVRRNTNIASIRSPRIKVRQRKGLQWERKRTPLRIIPV